MKKIVVCIIAFVIVGIVVAVFLKQCNEEDKQVVDTKGKQFRIETLSNKDIYFKADMALPDIPVVNDMMDMTNGYAILMAAYCDAELWFRFGEVVNDTIRQLATHVIKDKDIRTAAEQYVKTLVDILPRDTALWHKSDSVIWDGVGNAYDSFANKLLARFSLDHYGKITEEDVEMYMDARQFIPNYDSVCALRIEQTEENERYLKLMAEQAPSFDRECIYTIEYAHQRRHEEPHKAIPMLETLMYSGKFSRYLHEVWRTWRVLRQVAESPSRDGIILNLKYNRMRYRCLNTILKQIVKNPEDIYAVNDFCLLATWDNITRYSEFLFGNSAPLEHMMLFPEIVGNDDEEGENLTDSL